MDPTSGCWLWTGALSGSGYGRFSDVTHPTRSAHRWAHEFWNGPIPAGLTTDHKCHNRAGDCGGGPTCPHRRCVNPDHLEAVPLAVNLRRSPNTPTSINAAKTHCDRGHPFNEANTVWHRSGGRARRTCRACAPRHTANWRARRREADQRAIRGAA